MKTGRREGMVFEYEKSTTFDVTELIEIKGWKVVKCDCGLCSRIDNASINAWGFAYSCAKSQVGNDYGNEPSS